MNKTFWILIFAVLTSCSQNESKADSNQEISNQTDKQPTTYVNTMISSLDSVAYANLITDVATYMLRKPDAATWETKFDPEFRDYFEEKSKELSWLADIKFKDTTFTYITRDGRDNNGTAKRGVGVKIYIENNKISYFEELFVSKTKAEESVALLGQKFLDGVKNGESLNSFIEKNRSELDWPDGRLFYSVVKSEWRYVE